MNFSFVTLTYIFAIFVCSSAIAQFGPDAARERTRDRVLNAGDTTQEQSHQVVETQNIAYGSQERQKLDLYLPEQQDNEADALPLIVFVHGGGFTGGDKASGSNLGAFFAANNVITISANYRLPPNNVWPSGAEDIGDVIQWVHRNAGSYGIDTDRIFLMGHSAGAGHVASYVFFEEFQVFDDGVAGALLVSGPTYELELVLNEAGTQLAFDGEAAYFGNDLSKFPSMSSIDNLDGREIPLLVAYAEADMPNIQIQNAALIQALYERDQVLPTVIQGIGHDHLSIVRHIEVNSESVVSAQFLSFIQAH
jgi:acetyl esterase